MGQWGCRVLIWLPDAVQAAFVLGDTTCASEEPFSAVLLLHAGGGGPFCASFIDELDQLL